MSRCLERSRGMAKAMTTLLAAMLVGLIVAPAIAQEEGEAAVDPKKAAIAEIKKEKTAVNKQIQTLMRKAMKEDEAVKAVLAEIRELTKQLAEKKKSLVTTAAENNAELKELLAKEEELNKKFAELRSKRKPKGPKQPGEKKPKKPNKDRKDEGKANDEAW